MEQLNKVELRGIIGNVHTQKVGVSVVHRFSVATDYAYKGTDGMPVIETTWHNCQYWDSEENGAIQRGKGIHLFGRLRTRRYTDINGKEGEFIEILVNKLESCEI